VNASGQLLLHNQASTISVPNVGDLQLLEPGSDNFHQYGVNTTWAVKVVAKDYVRYWGYEGHPTLTVDINDDSTFTLPAASNISFNRVPLDGNPIRQYSGFYLTNTHWWGNTFSPLTIDDDGTLYMGDGDAQIQVEFTYDATSATVTIPNTNFKGTIFRTNFNLIGVDTITLQGTMYPNPESGPLLITGAMQPLPVPPLTRAELEQAIQTYGPVLQLHPDEIYNNTSIEYFLQHSSLVDTKTGVIINHPTSDQLPQGGDDHQYYLKLEDAAKGGDFSQAKAYVHAYWEPGMTYTDLQFWLFSAYNGPGTAHINGLIFDTIANTGDVNLAPMGEHFGDWECVMIRVDNKTKTMTNIWLSQHSSGQMYDQSQIATTFKMARNTHPIVYSSRNGHANYPSADKNYTEHRKYPDPGIPVGVEFFLRNDTADGGKSLDCSANYQVMTADWLRGADAYPVAKWVTYPFRWGPEGTTTNLSSDAVVNIVLAAAGPLAIFLPGFALTIIASQILPFFVTDDVNGPGAPITKDTWKGKY